MNLEKLVSQMTLKEKVGQLNQRLYGWEIYEKKSGQLYLTDKFKEEVARWDSLGMIYGIFRSDPWSGKNRETGLSEKEAFKVSQMVQEYLRTHTRLGIPALLSEECPHGHQGLDSLTTPVNYSVGASWNPVLYQKIQELVAQDIRRKGAHVGLISTLDVARDPRWGRTEECFSEDPFLTGQFTQAAVKGLQGNHVQVDGEHVLAVLKHFAGQGSAMGGHNSGPVGIGQREFSEIHLPPMIYGIKSGAQMTMAAYNDIDGILCHGNQYLLNQVLREQLGFPGAVMADGCALDRLAEVTGNREEAAAWALESGVDISLWDEVFPYLENAVISGRLSEELLDQAVMRVLQLKEKVGLFQPSPPQISEHSEVRKNLAIQLAQESLVLVKNKAKTLPLNSNDSLKLMLVGPNGDNLYNQLGDYTPFKDESQGITVLKGIKEAIKDTSVTLTHVQGCGITSEIPGGIKEALSVGSQADQIILALGGSSARDFATIFDANGAALAGSNEMISGENIDLADLRLPKVQVKLVRELAKLGKPLIAVLIQGRPHILKEIEPYLDAILIAGYPGEYGGRGVANTLFGASPSGKLAMSLPSDNGQLPIYYNYRDVAFQKDYVDVIGQPLYPFGYGLSYTDFTLSEVRIIPEKAGLRVKGKIKNIGGIVGAEVIQVYLKSHQTKVVTRVKELKGFTKIWLNPDEIQNFEICLNELELMEYNELLEVVPMKDVTVIVEALNYKYEERIKLI